MGKFQRNEIGNTHNAPGETTSHQGEADKQKQSSPPDRSRIAEGFLAANPVLVDQVNDEHSEERTNSWDPIDERDVHQHRFRVVGRFSVRREDRSIQEGPICDCELNTARAIPVRPTRHTHSRQITAIRPGKITRRA